ncbi:MAG: Lrp/AsnC family transcriptional regulator [Chloroflexi bacterium]|nr:Lrp/AsnC family transcriptional regulator [Chloroflexota bacterium]
MYQLDDMDIKILQVLQTDGRIPLTRLSEQFDIPHGTLRDRIRRMENAGVIKRYKAIIDSPKVGLLISCFAELVLDHQVETDRSLEVLMNIKEVTEVYLLAGETDAIVRIWARDTEHLREILYTKFSSVPGLIRSNTLMVLDAWEKPLSSLLDEQAH